MILLGCDPGFRAFGVVVVEVRGGRSPRIVKRTTLKNGPLAEWRQGLPTLLTRMKKIVTDTSPDVAGVEMITWHGRRRGSLPLAHLAGATYGLLWTVVPRVVFFTPHDVKTMSRTFPAPPRFDEHQHDALSICRLLAPKDDATPTT